MSLLRPFSAVRFLSICKSRYRGKGGKSQKAHTIAWKKGKKGEREREIGDRNGSIDGRSSLSPIVPSIGRRRRKK